MKPVDNLQPLYMNAACIVDEWIYFTTSNSSRLFRLNLITNNLEALHLLRGTKNGVKFSGLYYYKGMIWMIPWYADMFYIYHIENSRVEQLPIPYEVSEYSDSKQFRKPVIRGKYLWLLPREYPGIIKVDMEEKSYEIYDRWPPNASFNKTSKMNFRMMALHGDNIYLFNDACSMSIKLSAESGEMTEWKEGYNRSFGTVCNNKLYTSPVKKYEPVKIIALDSDEAAAEVALPGKIWENLDQYLYCYWYAKTINNKVFFMPHEANGIIVLDKETEKADILDIDISNYKTVRQHKNYAVYDILEYKDMYLTIPYQGNKIVLFGSSGIAEKEYLLETDDRYVYTSFNENERFNLSNYTDIIRCADFKKIKWKNDRHDTVNKNIGYSIHNKISGELDDV